MTLLRTHIFWRPNDVRHDCFSRDNVYFLIMQPSRKRLHSGGWIKKKIAFLRRFFPQSSIHTLGPYSSHPLPVHHLHSTLTFATILHIPPSPSPLSSHRTTHSGKPHTCAVFRILARNQYRAIVLQ